MISLIWILVFGIGILLYLFGYFDFLFKSKEKPNSIFLYGREFNIPVAQIEIRTRKTEKEVFEEQSFETALLDSMVGRSAKSYHQGYEVSVLTALIILNGKEVRISSRPIFADSDEIGQILKSVTFLKLYFDPLNINNYLLDIDWLFGSLMKEPRM